MRPGVSLATVMRSVAARLSVRLATLLLGADARLNPFAERLIFADGAFSSAAVGTTTRIVTVATGLCAPALSIARTATS